MIEVDIDSRTADGRFASMPKRVHDAILVAMRSSMEDLREYIVGEKLSGQVLNERTGRLKGSINASVLDRGPFIRGSVASSGVPYANIHEFGGDIYPVNAKYLAFYIEGKLILSKHVRIPERSYMRSSLADMKAEITARLERAVRTEVAK